MESASNLFDRLRKKVEAQSSRGGGFYSNENLLKLKIGEKYRLRLLWIPAPKGVNRENPMINQYIHRFWDDNAIGSKNIEVYCKTSQYDEGETKAGWDCPICKEMSNVYKEYSSTQSKSAKEIYDTFRRTFRGYVPVYIVSGPEEDQGKIKILQYTKSFKDFFDLHIFGIDKDSKDGQVDEDDILSINAFTYYEPTNNSVQLEGYDFIVTVGSKTIPIRGKNVQVPDYKLSFKNSKTEIDFGWGDETVENYLKLSETLSFDKDFLKKSTTEELENFLNKYIKNTSTEVESDNKKPEAVTEEVENPQIKKMKEMAKATSKKINNEESDEEEDEKPVKKEPPKASKVKDEEVKDDKNDDEKKSDDDEDLDLDKLLEGL